MTLTNLRALYQSLVASGRTDEAANLLLRFPNVKEPEPVVEIEEHKRGRPKKK